MISKCNDLKPSSTKNILWDTLGQHCGQIAEGNTIPEDPGDIQKTH